MMSQGMMGWIINWKKNTGHEHKLWQNEIFKGLRWISRKEMSWQRWTQRELMPGGWNKTKKNKGIPFKLIHIFPSSNTNSADSTLEESDTGPNPGLGVHPSLIRADVYFYFILPRSFLVQSLCSQTSRSGPASLELPDGQSDGLLVEFFHYLFDARQVGASDDKVAPSGAHLVAHLTLLDGEAVALCPGRYPVLPGVQQAPVIAISSWKHTQNKHFCVEVLLAYLWKLWLIATVIFFHLVQHRVRLPADYELVSPSFASLPIFSNPTRDLFITTKSGLVIVGTVQRQMKMVFMSFICFFL